MSQLEDVKQVTIRLPTEVKEYLDRLAARHRSSQSSEVIRMLRDKMDAETGKAAS